MKDFFSNIWVKRSISVFCIVYTAVIGLLAYATFLYDLEFKPGMEKAFFIIYTLASVVFLALMLITRRQKLTCWVSLLLPLVVFLLILFNIGDWVLIIPPFIVAVVMFFASYNRETTKVVLGTVYLLVYVLGIVLYIVLNMLFGGSSVETVLDKNLDPTSTVYRIYKDSNNLDKMMQVSADDNTISPDGKYKFYLVDVRDSDRGAVKVYVVPYGQDINLRFFTLKQKGIRKTITNKGIRGLIPDVGWTVKKNDSGENILYVQYRLTDQDKLRETSVTQMPAKQYFGFLGIS
ncbi:MAG: hypothetical protein IJU04_00075 [Ruminococcus sp.]|nr:hypothetical protein [Ruminococcus sp.]